MECKLIQPRTLDEALEVREKYTLDALPVAGGQSILVMLRNKLINPEVFIDLDSIEGAGLRGVEPNASGISIGPMTTYYQMITSSPLQQSAPVLAQAAEKVSSTAIRNLGTIGGNVCHNELGADLPPVLLTLNASAELRSRKGKRNLALSEFFKGYFETALEPDEILCRLDLEMLPARAAGVYLKHAISSEDLAMAGVAVVVVPDEQRRDAVSEVRIGLGGVAPVPLRAVRAEDALKGTAIDEKTAREAGEIAATEVDPETDAHASADYRRKMVKVLVRRALLQAIEEAKRSGNGKA